MGMAGCKRELPRIGGDASWRPLRCLTSIVAPPRGSAGRRAARAAAPSWEALRASVPIRSRQSAVRNRSSQSFTLVVLLSTLSFLGFAGDRKVETIGPLMDSGVPEILKTVLEPKGYRVMLSDGSPLCDVWFRSGVPSQPKADVPGVAYGELSESTFLGVVVFPKATKDYRGQSIKAGLYTLRYELLPSDGNHLGAAPTRDFLLLVPLAVDRDVSDQFKFEELVKMSQKASGTNHPAPFSMVPVESPGSLPAVVEKEGHTVLLARLRTQSGSELPIGLVVEGTAEQ